MDKYPDPDCLRCAGMGYVYHRIIDNFEEEIIAKQSCSCMDMLKFKDITKKERQNDRG